MSEEKWSVPSSLAGERLDKAVVQLAGAGAGASRARVKKAILSGAVRVNGRVVAKGALVQAGDEISLASEEAVRAGDSPCIPEDGMLTVRYESPLVLVVDKPAGQPTAPLRADETGTLANVLAGRYPELQGVGYSAREPGIVHRLDTDTSGLVVVARTARAFEVLRDALQNEQLTKEYLLLCAADGLPDEGTIEIPIANHPKDKRRVYPCIHPRDVMRYAPRPATTRYRVERREGAVAVVRAEAPRAIRHQLRAHFAAIGHPLLGDRLYTREGATSLDLADGSAESAPTELSRHALHAVRVAFDGAGEAGFAFDVTSPLPDDLAAVLTA